MKVAGGASRSDALLPSEGGSEVFIPLSLKLSLDSTTTAILLSLRSTAGDGGLISSGTWAESLDMVWGGKDEDEDVIGVRKDLGSRIGLSQVTSVGMIFSIFNFF